MNWDWNEQLTYPTYATRKAWENSAKCTGMVHVKYLCKKRDTKCVCGVVVKYGFVFSSPFYWAKSQKWISCENLISLSTLMYCESLCFMKISMLSFCLHYYKLLWMIVIFCMLFYCVPLKLPTHQLLVPLVGPKSGANKDPTGCLQMRSQPRTNLLFPKWRTNW